MRYENRQPAEGINVDEAGSPLREFLVLSGLIALGSGLIVVALALSAQYLAKYVPFSAEQQLAGRFEKAMTRAVSFDKEQAALQAIVDKLRPGLDLPPDMTIKVHYLDEPTVNAFATLGGHVFVYRGLLARLPSENALAFVLAHEMAHVKHRHPAQSLGRGVAIGLALTAIGAGTGGTMAERPLGAAGLLTTLSFTRGHETEADESALQALVRAYGNAGGAIEVFRVFQEVGHEREAAPEFLMTHPQSKTRSETVRELAKTHGWPLAGEHVALPAALRKTAKEDSGKPRSP